MHKVLTINCSDKVIHVLQKLLGDRVVLSSAPYEEGRIHENYAMVVLETGTDLEQDLKRTRTIRYSCNFRNLPIILIHTHGDHRPMEPFLSAGATELLSLNDPPAACRQILQGYLIPDRDPVKEEMEYLEMFIKNTCNVLKTMAGMKVQFKEVYFCEDLRIFGDISGIIGLFGKAEGTLVITFYWKLAQKIIAQMMNVQINNINAELIHDGVAEIINMISGSTKKDFVNTKYHFEISLPSVVVGSGHQIGHPGNSTIAVLIFDAEEGSFALQVCIKPRS